jgi:hypothetical protein
MVDAVTRIGRRAPRRETWLGGALAALAMTQGISHLPALAAEPTGSPVVIPVEAAEAAASPVLARLVQEVRTQTDVFLVLSGGASRMAPATRARLLALLDALPILAERGVRPAVGDGGTQAGIMEAAGLARRAANGAFPLIGVAPAPNVTTSGEVGKTPVDPNHSHVVTVTNPAWSVARRAEGWTPASGFWGSETATMYALFARLAEGRPSVALVANGGTITLDEVHANLVQRRPIVVVAGSGRAADAIVSLLQSTTPDDEEVRRLREQASALDVPAHRDLFHVFQLEGGPQALATLLQNLLRRP